LIFLAVVEEIVVVVVVMVVCGVCVERKRIKGEDLIL